MSTKAEKIEAQRRAVKIAQAGDTCLRHLVTVAELEMMLSPVDQSAKERRERIATAILAGMWANEDLSGIGFPYEEKAIKSADALMSALDKESEGKTPWATK